MKTFVAGLGSLVARRAKLVLVLCGVVTGILAIPASTVRLDINFTDLFKSGSADQVFNAKYTKTFSVNEDTLVAIVQTAHGHAPSEEFFDAVAAVTKAAGQDKRVDLVASVTNTGVVRPASIAVRYGPAFADDMSSLTVYQRVDLARESELGTHQLISEDGKATLVSIQLKPNLRSYEDQLGPAEAFMTRVQKVIKHSYSDVATVQFAGVGITKLESIQQSTEDLAKLIPIALVVMIVLLWWFFRNVLAILATIAAIIASVVCTMGVVGLMGYNLSQVTSAFPILLMGVVVATATHVIHRYFMERTRGSSSAEACKLTVINVAGVSLLCSITNAIGFLSLLTSRMSILHEFGLFLAMGVGFCFIFTAAIIPALLHLTDATPPAYYGATTTTTLRIDRWTHRYATWMTRPRNAVGVSLVGVVLLVAGVAEGRTAIYNYAVKQEFPADTVIGRANHLLDTKLDGTIPVEVSVKGSKGDFLEPANLTKLRELSAWLRDSQRVYTLGIPSFLTAVDQLGLPQPTSADQVSGYLALIDSQAGNSVVNQVLNSDRSHTRLAGLRAETGSREYLQFIKKVNKQGNQIFKGTDIKVQVTGSAAVGYRGVNDLTKELIAALAVAVALIVAAIAVGFRSVVMAGITILPNALPLAVGFGLYTLIFPQVDPLPAVVFCIVMGIAADDTVHLVNRYRIIRAAGVAPRLALIEAFVTLRRAMVSSTVVLVAAFAVVGWSTFPSTQITGFLGAGVLLLALLADLIFGLTGIAIHAWISGRMRGDADGVIDLTSVRTAETAGVVDAPQAR